MDELGGKREVWGGGGGGGAGLRSDSTSLLGPNCVCFDKTAEDKGTVVTRQVRSLTGQRRQPHRYSNSVTTGT